MNRTFYSFAIFISAITAALGLVHAIIFFQIGGQILAMESFGAWYLWSTVLGLASALVLLKYFRHKNYNMVFWLTVLGAIAGLFQFLILYSVMKGIREVNFLYVPAVLFVLAANGVCSLSMTFSKTAERPWLKAAGIAGVILSAFLLTSVLWSLPDPQRLILAEKVNRWAILAGNTIPLMLAMNFLRERERAKKPRPEEAQRSPGWAESLVVITAGIATIMAIAYGSALAKETVGKISWDNQLAEKAKAWEKLFESREFISASGKKLQYQLLKPIDHDPQKKYPVVVCLPYHKGVIGSPAAQVLLQDIYRKQYPSFIYVPFCPEGEGWGGIPNYPTIDTPVFESLLALENEFPEIDSTRRYITGVSRGGYGSWHFISERPEMFAAAVPVCGAGDPDRAKKIALVPVWAFHGANDVNVPVSGSRAMIEAMRKAGGDPKYTEYEDAAHNIWDRVSASTAWLDWMFAQKRD